jgi:glycerol uptake facilitator protein
MNRKKLSAYILGQFIGAFLAGLVIYALFSASISNYEEINSITRGDKESIATAKMFGEYYKDTGSSAVVTMPLAMGAEALGTFILVLLVFALTEGCNVGRPDNALAPLFIGLTVTSIICLIAPLTQAGINPARDFGPRMVAWIFGWKGASFPDQNGGFFFVYILAPLFGGAIASGFFVRVIEPAMKSASDKCICTNENPKVIKK